jgi:hypothetical protein
MVAVTALHLRLNVRVYRNLVSNNVCSEYLPIIKTDTLYFELSHFVTVVKYMFHEQKFNKN